MYKLVVLSAPKGKAVEIDLAGIKDHIKFLEPQLKPRVAVDPEAVRKFLALYGIFLSAFALDSLFEIKEGEHNPIQLIIELDHTPTVVNPQVLGDLLFIEHLLEDAEDSSIVFTLIGSDLGWTVSPHMLLLNRNLAGCNFSRETLLKLALLTLED